MNFDQIVVKESPGLCRCCLSEGCYKDLGSEYTWMNETEIYADMLLECFDISISQHNEGPNGPNRLICEVCITRLRDACNFKKQVLDSEKKFVDMVGRGEFKSKVLVFESDMKLEPDAENIEETEVEYLEESMDYEDDDKFLSEIAAEAATSADIIEAPPAKAKRGRPKRTTTVIKQEKKVKVPKLEEKPRSSKTATKDKTEKARTNQKDGTKSKETKSLESNNDMQSCVKEEPDLVPQRKKDIVRRNIVQVLLKSTVMPFKWLRSSYRCFYCYEVFTEPKHLKNHQQIHTDDQEKHKVMNNFWDQEIYVDVSNISCKICPENIVELQQLIDHLISKHDVEFNKDVGSCISPFKLNDTNVACAFCETSFQNFGRLLAHKIQDHGGIAAILCDICGQNFKTNVILKIHKRTVHSVGTNCKKCGVSVGNENKLRTHMEHFHNKTYKCRLCSKEFESHYHRRKHLTVVHGVKELVKCPQCPLTFVHNSVLRKHMSATHMKEKNVVCNICGWRGYKQFNLTRHMVKHTDVRDVQCPFCDKAFKAWKTMRQHCLNIHKKAVMKRDFSKKGTA